MQDINELLLEASSLRFQSASGEVKYCSSGHEKVVTV
jgi:ribosomal protein L29